LIYVWKVHPANAPSLFSSLSNKVNPSGLPMLFARYAPSKWHFLFILTWCIETCRFFFSNCNGALMIAIDKVANTTGGTASLLAMDDSFGFFNNIPNDRWEHRRDVARNHKDWLSGRNRQLASIYFIENYFPFFTCSITRRFSDRVREICGPKRIIQVATEQKRKCLVYSFDYQNFYQWEVDLNTLVNRECEIHIFHPLQKPMEQFKDLNIHVHPWFLSGTRDALQSSSAEDSDRLLDKVLTDGQSKSLLETMTKLGHSDRILDVLRVDCAGCEFHVYKEWLDVDIRQLLVTTYNAPKLLVTQFFSDIQLHGYASYSKEPDIHPSYKNKKILKIYWGMIKLKPSFRDFKNLHSNYQHKQQ